MPAEAKRVFGRIQPDGSCSAMVEGLRDYPSAGVWYLGLVLVHPALRSQGIGSELVRGFEQVARASGAREVRVCVFDDRSRARAFWQRNGYQFRRAVAPTLSGASLLARTEWHKMLDGTRAA